MRVLSTVGKRDDDSASDQANGDAPSAARGENEVRPAKTAVKKRQWGRPRLHHEGRGVTCAWVLVDSFYLIMRNVYEVSTVENRGRYVFSPDVVNLFDLLINVSRETQNLRGL